MAQQDLWLVYGATGYTGRRTVEAALAMGERPVLAGRGAAELQQLADTLGLDWIAFDLSDQKAIIPIIAEYSTVLHCAGPFQQTYQPMIEACLAAGTHYLDITGEMEVYEALAALSDRAEEAGITIMPGVGFDMVPGDCLALLLKNEMPDATELSIGYSFDGTVSRGSIRTALSSFSPNAMVRRNGQLSRLATPLAKCFDFGTRSGVRTTECYATTFGDISIGWRTTGIPNVTSYLDVTEPFQKIAAIVSEAEIATLPAGPSDEELRTHTAHITAEVRNPEGVVRAARLTTPQIYAITFSLAATIAKRVHHAPCPRGFQTPAAVFGAGFILGFDGCSLEWLDAGTES